MIPLRSDPWTNDRSRPGGVRPRPNFGGPRKLREFRPPVTLRAYNSGLGRPREIRFTVLERGIIGLSYGISFILIGAGNRKLLRVKVNNLGYFWVLEAQVTFSYLLLN